MANFLTWCQTSGPIVWGEPRQQLHVRAHSPARAASARMPSKACCRAASCCSGASPGADAAASRGQISRPSISHRATPGPRGRDRGGSARRPGEPPLQASPARSNLTMPRAGAEPWYPGLLPAGWRPAARHRGAHPHVPGEAKKQPEPKWLRTLITCVTKEKRCVFVCMHWFPLSLNRNSSLCHTVNPHTKNSQSENL